MRKPSLLRALGLRAPRRSVSFFGLLFGGWGRKQYSGGRYHNKDGSYRPAYSKGGKTSRRGKL
jgi:hypothetical protein